MMGMVVYRKLPMWKVWRLVGQLTTTVCGCFEVLTTEAMYRV